ncbi:MAG: NAD-dependent epimerase/dehydratase [Deltaproteobacteria bacterium]|nr:NAD-dependent epimerase/dehydratase [Deltaproteobacteria bacterium]
MRGSGNWKNQTEERKVFNNKEVLVTGGLGFIGSNLCIELVRQGAHVTIVDNMLPRQGGNLFNISDIEGKVTVNISDVRNQLSMNHLVKGKDYIFHLAGQVNHVDSMKNPLQDLEINCRGTLVLLEALRHHNREGKVIFAGTRGEYGSSVSLPVDEDHPTNPKGIYAVTNLTAEKLVLVYDDVFKVKGTCLRITNTYGPRHQMAHDEYGVFNWFIRKAMDNEEIPVMGDGRILRDFLYVEDLVSSMLKAASTGEAYGKVLNVGTGLPVSFFDLAEKIVAIAGSGRTKFTEFTQERKEVEPGDYYADISRIKKTTGWEPVISLDEGIARTIDFYRQFRKEYW